MSETGVPAVNFALLNELSVKPHPLLHIADDLRQVAESSLGEVMQQARNVHHLLDLAGVPIVKGYRSDVDARTYLLVNEVSDLRERMGRISGWHARETGPAGMVGDFCTECGQTWPCDTRRMANGTFDDGEMMP